MTIYNYIHGCTPCEISYKKFAHPHGNEFSGELMFADWGSLFDNFGIKRVSGTDKSKSAYVPTINQCNAVAAAGVSPAPERPAPQFDLTVLFDPGISSVKSGYYHAGRGAEANRPPEPRMGGELISAWLNIGDEVLIGNIGRRLYAFKLSQVPGTEQATTEEVARKTPRDVIFARALRASGPPRKRNVTKSDFVRNPYVVAAALLRAQERCEMPSCTHTLFIRDDGTHYLEVHHIVLLSAGGDDTLRNVAALCPHCHREMHHGTEREQRRQTVAVYIASLPLWAGSI